MSDHSAESPSLVAAIVGGASLGIVVGLLVGAIAGRRLSAGVDGPSLDIETLPERIRNMRKIFRRVGSQQARSSKAAGELPKVTEARRPKTNPSNGGHHSL